MAVRDVVFAAVILFIVGMTFFIFNFAFNTMFDSFIATPALNQSNHTVAVFQGTQTNLVNRLDYLVMGVFIALSLGIIVTAWFIPGEPLFVFIYVIVWIIAVVFSSIEAYVWDTVKTQGKFVTAQTLSHFPITDNLLSFLPVYIAVLGFIGVVVIFAKPRE